MDLNRHIDHTLLKPDGSLAQVTKLCQEARDNKFYSVCVNSYFVQTAAQLLSGSDSLVCTVVGFPLGASTMETKRFEAMKAIADGAREIDMVLNVSAVKSGHWQYALDDISSLVKICHQQGTKLKVILETCLLTEEEKKRACDLVVKAQADFVKTSTGFSTGGATLEDVKLMRSIVGEEMGVKASGGIRSFEAARLMIEAGASRLGTSASVEIMKGQSSDSNY